MVCIIDDREDVWKFAPNLITVKKYVYFQGIGDINAPPGSREIQMKKKGNYIFFFLNHFKNFFHLSNMVDVIVVVLLVLLLHLDEQS